MTQSNEMREARQFRTETAIVEENPERFLLRIQDINRHAFLGKDVFDTAELSAALKNPRSVLVLVTDTDSREVVGYGLAVPTNKPTEAHYLSNALLPEYQGAGLVAGLTPMVEGGLRNKGFVQYTSDVVSVGGYADKVRKAHGKKVIRESVIETAAGPSVHFTIEL